MKKRKVRKQFYPKYINLNASWWCINNGIKIYPKIQDKKEKTYKLIIETDKPKRKIISPVVYDIDELNEKTFEIYTKLFKKNANEDLVKKATKGYIKSQI